MNIRRAVLLVVVVCVFSSVAVGQPWDGNGVEGDPYQIWDACDMQAIGADANYWDAHFELMVDIDLGGYTGAEYNIIGNLDTPFRGVFDGNGHRIYNFTYDSNVVNYIGLFWYVDDPNSEIKNLGLIDPNIDGYGGTVSSLVVRLGNGTVTDCYVEGGRISGLGSAGGLVGSLGFGPTATVSNCHASVNVSGGSVGGLVCSNHEATISNCYSTGSVTGNGYRVGGLVGENIYGGEISDCYSTCAVSGDLYVGGLVGDNDDSAHISNSSATGNVTGTGKFIGGLVGANHGDGTISGCYAGGDVSGKYYVGGLVGTNTSDILNSYANGSILGGYDVGGLVGENWNGTISNCYSAGSVSGNYNIGGLVGYDDGASYTRCFWDNTVNPSLTGIGNGSNPEVVGESTTNMQMAITFAGWGGCEPVWTIDDGNDYPRLLWEDAPGLPLSGYLYAGGSGEANDPFLIETGEQLNWIGLIECSWEKHFRLIADVDLSAYTGDSFNIIGRYVGTDDPDNKPFTGVFDGNDHTISNFTYESDGVSHVGLFGYVDDVNAEIKDLGLVNADVNVDTGDYVGSLVGTLISAKITGCYIEDSNVSGVIDVGGLIGATSGADISNCYVRGRVSGEQRVGGLVGYNEYGSIYDCNAGVVVFGDSGVAGLVGGNYYGGTLRNCYSWGEVYSNLSAASAAGLAVGNDGEILSCYSECDVNSNGGAAAGLVVWNGNVIIDCYSTGSVSGDSSLHGGVGGLVSRNDGEISGCYGSGDVSGVDQVGGLVGYNSGSGVISNCYSTGDVSGDDDVGGLVGRNTSSDIITNCYSVGVVSGTSDVGGLVGYDSSGGYRKSFWDSDINPDVNGIGNTTDPNVIGETTANMQMESTFTDAGWDFVDEVINGPNDVWTICEGEDYPRLAWEKYGGGNGTEANPYLIRTSCQMNAIGANSNDWDAHFKLMADIDLGIYTGTSFNVIGNTSYKFTGVFDGSSHTISNFTYNSTGTSRIGIFGYVDDPNAEIKDLGLINSNVEVIGGSGNVGSLVGRLVTGTVSRCYVEAGTVSADPDYDVGGLVGNSEEGLIRESYSTASVFGGIAAGGLVGYNEGAISDCHSSGDVTTSNFVGGLVGYNRSTILNCYSTGNVAQGSFIGGLVGYDNLGLYTKCFWDRDVNPDVNGIGNATDPNVIGESTANMQTESTFTDAGWDFVGEVINGPNDIWDICEGTNYPKFVWQIPAADFVCPDGVNFIDYAFFAEHWLQSIYGDCGEVELTGDGKVNWVDFALFAEYWKLTGCGECGGADFTGDENVDLADLYVFATYWLETEYAEVDLTNDGQVGLDDLREFTDNWLAGM